jgi:hypothetical protein
MEEEKGRKSTRVEGDNEVLGGSGDYDYMGEEEKNGREHTTMEGGGLSSKVSGGAGAR